MPRATTLIFLVSTVFAGSVLAQPTVQDLLKEIEKLRGEMATQRESFEEQIAKLQTQVDTGLQDELQSRIEDIVADKSKFYRSPPESGRSWSERSVFEALKGGLIFTGLFRSRFEYRSNNVDFNSSDNGIDDEGVRFNGRFRLGFGAVIERGNSEEPVISALTEFQAYGTFANNTYFSFSGPGGIPLPTDFTIFREPFEQVGIYQGYLSFERAFSVPLHIKVGRQELVQGAGFVLGNNSFYDGTVHDALVVDYDIGDLRLTGFFAKEAQSDTELAVIFPAQDFDEDHLFGLYAHLDAGENLDFDAYGLYFDSRSNFTDSFVTRSTNFGFDGAYNPSLVGHFWTLGARALIHSVELFGGTLTVNAEAAYQTGSNGLSDALSGGLDEQPLHGWATELIVNYWISPDESPIKPILTLAYYHAGGGELNPDTQSGFPLNNVGFQPLFINRHFSGIGDRLNYSAPYFPGGGRYGNLDLIPLNNTHIFKAAFSISPSEKIEVGVGGLMALTADDEGFGTGVFGYELDLFGSYRHSEFLRFEASFGVFFPQKTAEDASNYFFFSSLSADQSADNEPALAFYMQALIEF